MQDDEADRLNAIAMDQPPFARLLGLRILTAKRDLVEAEMEITPELGNRNGVLHGGALMGFVDNIGGTATFLNLTEDEATTTLESKTNFFRPIAIGDVAHATCTTLHKGRRTMVCQITVTRRDGKVAAVVIQTQMIMQSDKTPT